MSRPLEIALDRPGAERLGFFTDTTVCIGCKACQVACKQWNDLPGMQTQFRPGGSYDYQGSLGAETWRHVRFVERLAPSPELQAEAQARLAEGGGGHVPAIPATGGFVEGGPPRDLPSVAALGDAGSGVQGDEMPDLVQVAENGGGMGLGASPSSGPRTGGVDVEGSVRELERWVFMSDVCKHCTNAGCHDACPTGAIIRTEFSTVIIQPDVCNGCGYCIPACPFGVITRDPSDGRAAKCTLCYDRLQDGLEPACAKACPTDSIQFGPYGELVETARARVSELHDRGFPDAYLYGAGDEPGEQLAGGLGAFFLLTDPPERFGLPAQADSPVQENVVEGTVAALAAGALASASVIASFLVAHRGGGGDRRARGFPGRGRGRGRRGRFG